MFHRRLDKDIELRLLELRHAPEVFARIHGCRAYLRVWLPWVDQTQDVADVEAFIREAIGQFANGEAVHVGIWYGGVFAGVVGYHLIDLRNRIGEIGYWLGEAFQGRGIMTKACRAMVAYGFSERGFNRIEMHCAPGNRKSRAIPERLGFRIEGTLRQAEKFSDRFVDNVVYGLLASEYAEGDEGV